MTRKQKAMALIVVVMVTMAPPAAQASSACYSQFEGCEATAAAIATAAALPK